MKIKIKKDSSMSMWPSSDPDKALTGWHYPGAGNKLQSYQLEASESLWPLGVREHCSWRPGSKECMLQDFLLLVKWSVCSYFNRNYLILQNQSCCLFRDNALVYCVVTTAAKVSNLLSAVCHMDDITYDIMPTVCVLFCSVSLFFKLILFKIRVN